MSVSAWSLTGLSRGDPHQRRESNDRVKRNIVTTLNIRGISDDDARRFRAGAKLAGMTMAQYVVALMERGEQ